MQDIAEHPAPPRVQPIRPVAGTWRYLICGTLFIAFLLCGVVSAAFNIRSSTLEDARRSLAQLGSALAGQTSRSMQGVDLVLQDTINRLGDGGANLLQGFGQRMGTEEVYKLLQDRLRSVPQADAISVVDSHGQVMNFTRSWPPPAIDVSDRDYFQTLSLDQDASVYLSMPVRNRGNTNWTMYLAHRVNGTDNVFLGLLLGAISLDYMEQLYRAVATQPGSAVTLLRRDGVILARFPHDESLIGSRPPDKAEWDAAVLRGGGIYGTERGLSGEREIVSMELLPNYSLVLQTSVTEAAALQGWQQQTAGITLFSILAAACLALLLCKISSQFAAQAHAKHALTLQNAELQDAHNQLAMQASALQDSERRVAEQSRTLQTTLENIDQGLLMVTAEQVVAVYNQRVIEMMGLSEELLARRPTFDEILASQWQTNEFENTPEQLVAFIKAGGIRPEAHVYERERPNGRVIEIRSLPLPGGGVVRTYTKAH